MKRKTQNANFHKKVESAKKSRSNQNFPKIPIESTRCDSELKIIDFFDLSQDDDECSDENKKAQNEIIENNDDINNDLLGKKRKIANAKNPKIIDDEDPGDKNSNEINDTDNAEYYSSFDINIDEANNKIKKNSEKQELIDLVKKEGFNKVFDLISNIYFDRRNYLERKLDDIISNIGLLRTSIILLGIKFSQPQSQIPEELNANPNPNFHPPCSKSEDKITKTSPGNQIINNEEYELAEHFHKEKQGKKYIIYKYNKHHFRVKNRISYNCADLNCKSRGLYFVNNMKFRVMTNHSIPYEEHCYVKNKEKYARHKAIFDDFMKRNCHEAQVFKNDMGDKLVKWYDN